MPSEALAKEGRRLHYVYFLTSERFVGERYIGITADLKGRFADHNRGKSTHTSKFRPWRIVTYIAFSNRSQAEAFETYVKSGSGHAFAKKRLW